MQSKITEIEFGSVSGPAVVGEELAVPGLKFFERILKARMVDVFGTNIETGEEFTLRPRQLHGVLLKAENVEVLAIVNNKETGEKEIVFSPDENLIFHVREAESLKIARLVTEEGTGS